MNLANVNSCDHDPTFTLPALAITMAITFDIRTSFSSFATFCLFIVRTFGGKKQRNTLQIKWLIVYKLNIE